MGFENEAEQSFGRPYRQIDGRSKRTNELTSSIVPRGTSFHRSVELECSPIACDLVRPSCRCGLFPGPAELGAINPYAVHDYGEPACQCHDCLFLPAASGDLHRPGLEPCLLYTSSIARRRADKPTRDRRASATIAFFFPRRLAICIAQALSQDHLFECSMA